MQIYCDAGFTKITDNTMKFHKANKLKELEITSEKSYNLNGINRSFCFCISAMILGDRDGDKHCMNMSEKMSGEEILGTT